MIRPGIRYFTFASALLLLTKKTEAQDPSNYVISLMEHLAHRESGIPTCIFFDMSTDRPFDDILGHVIQSPRLDHVTKYVLSSAKIVDYMDLPSNPTLMVVDVGGYFVTGPGFAGKDKFVNPFLSADPATKLLVLVNTKSDDFEKIVVVCNHFSYSNVVYLDVKNRQLFRGNGLGIEQLSYMVPEGILFSNALRNITGWVISFSTLILSDLIPDVKWVEETARFLNTTTFGVPLLLGLKTDIILDTFRLYWFSPQLVKGFRVCITPTLEALVVLVPKDCSNIADLFMMPFNREVWFMVISFLIISEGVKFFLPTLLKNDPVLLIVCGYEKYDLNKASRFEKIFLHSLMIFIFFTTSAYETKIISFMINKPYTNEINTFDDLLQSDIKIVVDADSSPKIVNDTQFAGLFIPGEKMAEMDKMPGYIAIRESAPFLIPMYNYQTQRCPTYTALDDPITMVTRAYAFTLRNPLLKTFEYTYQAFVESGIMSYWNWHFYKMCDIVISKNITTYDVIEEKEILEFSDLIPAWTALAGGLVVGFLIFIAEIIARFCQSRGRVGESAAPLVTLAWV